MGNTQFLTGGSSHSRPNLGETINALQDASVVFVGGYQRQNYDQAGRASKRAMECFDFIVGEVMRHRDMRKDNGTYLDSEFENEMNSIIATMLSPVTRNEHIAVVNFGPGNGRMPDGPGEIKEITMERTLNKIKHRNPGYGNFRIDENRHIFVICPDKTNGSGPDSVVEFDVENFCNQMRKISAVIWHM